MPRRAFVIAALVVVPAALAHDYWLEPETYSAAPGDTVTVRLHVGEDFTSQEERPFQKKMTAKSQLHSAKQVQDLAGEDGKTPLAKVKLPAAGGHLVALERGVATITLDADKFNKYLEEEGQDAVLEQRRKAGEDKSPGRERYTRYLKALVQAGDAHDDVFKMVLGQRLEIVPQAGPATLEAGGVLPVRVLFEGKPLAGAKVSAHHRTRDKVVTLTATTSKEGLAEFKLEQAGPWLVRLVHVRRCEKCDDADWESFWAAYTFALR
jgi:uncharacterized GH25 family protein